MFKGSNVALVTPFKNNKLDEEPYIKLIHFHINNGTNGLVPAGTTGESPTLSHGEHERVIELCLNQSEWNKFQRFCYFWDLYPLSINLVNFQHFAFLRPIRCTHVPHFVPHFQTMYLNYLTLRYIF